MGGFGGQLPLLQAGCDPRTMRQSKAPGVVAELLSAVLVVGGWSRGSAQLPTSHSSVAHCVPISILPACAPRCALINAYRIGPSLWDKKQTGISITQGTDIIPLPSRASWIRPPWKVENIEQTPHGPLGSDSPRLPQPHNLYPFSRPRCEFSFSFSLLLLFTTKLEMTSTLIVTSALPLRRVHDEMFWRPHHLFSGQFETI